MRLLVFFLFMSSQLFSQSTSTYVSGTTANKDTLAAGGVCLMGGATEDDNAMEWFLNRANGGDVVVLRTSGSDGYNNYMYNFPGISLNSVITIVFNDASGVNDSFIQTIVGNAEAIWFAGGDQWEYVSYWRNSPIDSIIRSNIENRSIAVGGTSAGMAILGGYYFSAENGTVTSSAALNNPYDLDVTIDSTMFLALPQLHNVITDTHYDDPDRKGRHTVFLSRIFEDYSVPAKGIACDEYTSVCIDTNGVARVFGGFPTYDDNAYFIQTNCNLVDESPEICANNVPLTWNRGGEALKVYQIKGNASGTNSFDISNWQTGNGGVWKNWFVQSGMLNESFSSPLDCGFTTIDEFGSADAFQIYPNPSTDFLNIKSNDKYLKFQIFDTYGRLVMNGEINGFQIDINQLEQGVYRLEISGVNSAVYQLFIKN